MKHLQFFLSIVLLCCCCSADNSKTQQNEKDVCDKLLKRVDITNPHYGNKIYGSSRTDMFRSKDSSLLLVFQASYGGDGDHTGNQLKLFRFHGDSGKKVLDINIDSVKFEKDFNHLKYIRGRTVESLCDVCDGWEAAPPEDVFLIPIIIDVEALTIKADLAEKEKNDFLSRFEQQVKKDVAEQTSYGNKGYLKNAEKVSDRMKSLLNNQ
jgi:hypothetical protein